MKTLVSFAISCIFLLSMEQARAACVAIFFIIHAPQYDIGCDTWSCDDGSSGQECSPLLNAEMHRVPNPCISPRSRSATGYLAESDHAIMNSSVSNGLSAKLPIFLPTLSDMHNYKEER